MPERGQVDGCSKFRRFRWVGRRLAGAWRVVPSCRVVSRRFGAVDDPEIHAFAAGDYDLVTVIARLFESSGDMLAVALEERLAYLAQNGYNASEVQVTIAVVESWLNSGNRRVIRGFDAGADALGTGLPGAFREWFDGEPANSLVLAVLGAGVRDPGLALSYAVAELCDELRAAYKLAMARLHVPDWETMPETGEDCFAQELDRAYRWADAETWPVY